MRWKFSERWMLKFMSEFLIYWGKWIFKLLFCVWNLCISFWYVLGSNVTWWWIYLSVLINSYDKKRVIKRQCDYLLVCDLLKMLWKTWLNHYWRCIMNVLLWIAQFCENGYLLIICVDILFALFWELIVTSVMCIEKEWELKKDVPFRGIYCAPQWILYFEGRITRYDGYYYRGSCSAPR